MVTCDSRREANAFIKILVEVLETDDEDNGLCAMLSGYIWAKLIQADPERIERLREEQKAYKKALAEKRAQRR